jgi:hypothetical protein
MSARGFKSVLSVGMVAGAALACYLVSLNVAAERAALEAVETDILLAQRDIRSLETEIGTRGRLAQLERWNVRVIQLSAPTADQFVEGGFQLATLVKPERRPAIEAPVVLAAAPRPEPRAQVTDDGAVAPPPYSKPLGEMLHVASYSRPDAKTGQPAPRAAAPARRPAQSVAKPAVKTSKIATADPLGPLPTGAAKAKGTASPKKDSGSQQ